MDSQETPGWADKLAKYTRMGLLAGIAVVVALLLTSPRHREALVTGKAYADGGISAAPDFLLLTINLGNASKLYIVDKDKQVICVYSINGAKLRLVSARKFDADSDIVDASLSGTGPGGKAIKALEGGSGVDRNTAKEYSDALKKWLEDAKVKW